mmetsp:Transcript_1898/g.4766  ORF Transcript_1898/g.4766 Transcript_1898/m.4766 type:complete len:282 (-) Transcript_1898:34-879(-)
MPSITLGTCCGSQANVGLKPWLEAGATGIDTAWDYSDPMTGLTSEEDIAKVLAGPGMPPRSSLFVTTKIPAGFGNATDCYDPEALPGIAMAYMEDNLRRLNMKQVDLALVHNTCAHSRYPTKAGWQASNQALWKGMQMALAAGLTKSIGVSNFAASDLEALDFNGNTPAVDQCHMSVQSHDDTTIAYCQQHGIFYESYGTLKGCPTEDADVKAIAASHSVSTYQVCLRWVLDRGCIMAAGTGSNASTVGPYAAENLAIYNFTLTAAEMAKLNGKGARGVSL